MDKSPRQSTEAQQAQAMLFCTRDSETTDPWLARMLASKPKMLVAVALANQMAWTVWALATRGETYRVCAAA